MKAFYRLDFDDDTVSNPKIESDAGVET